MKKTVFYSTKNLNSYLYDSNLSFLMLIHPNLERVHKKSSHLDSYYLKKYQYLKQNGFFKEDEMFQFATVLDENVIKENIIQTRQIIFEATDYCNLNCQYCSLGELYEFSKKDSKNIDINYALNFLEYIFQVKHEYTPLTISFFGGEPLVNVGFIKQIVQSAKTLNREKKLELRFNITTNATLIHKYIRFLVENNFTLLISLDGDEKAQSYRVFLKNGKNSFSKVIENIDMIKIKYPEYFISNVDFNAVLHNRNSVKEIYEFIYNRYHKIPIMSQMNLNCVNPHKRDIFDEMFSSIRKSEEEFQNEESDLLPIVHEQLQIFEELKKFLNNYSVNFYLSNLVCLLYDQVRPLPTGTCSPFHVKMFINTNHDLLPCERVSHKYRLGKVDDIVSIDISQIVHRYNFYYKHLKNVCQYCYAGRSCSVCLLTMENLDKLGTEDFTCLAFEDENSFKEKLIRIFSFLEKNPGDFFKIINNGMIN